MLLHHVKIGNWSQLFREKPGLVWHEAGPYLHHRVNPLQIGHPLIPAWNPTGKRKSFEQKLRGKSPKADEAEKYFCNTLQKPERKGELAG